ncbi:MAG: amidohydrolase family protein [Gemmatimonadetes bacterium]|nr:amidohydrolase family protein [Gemmatimonadota bacterium]
MRIPICCALLSAACAPVGSSSPPTPAATLAITHVTVVDVTGGPARPGQTVLVSGDRIVAVGPAAQVRVPRGARVVEGAGRYLIPGLWDMHAHAVGYGDTAGQPALKLSLAHGVTGLRDMGSHPFQTARAWRDAIAAGRMLGPRMLIASPVVENPRWLAAVRRWEEEAGKSTEWMNGRFGPGTVDEARRFVDSAVAIGADHIKVRNWPAPEISAALVARARERGIPVVAHGNRPFPEAGVASYEHSIFPSLDEGRDSLFRQWAGSGAAFVPTLVASFARLHPTDSVIAWIDPARTPKLRYAPARLRNDWRQELEIAAKNERPFDWRGHHQDQLRDLREMRRAGVRILAASDFGAPLTIPGVDLHEELAKFVSDVGMTPLEALRAATLHPAEFLGLADSLGTIAPGMLADLVLLDADPLADIRNTRRIHAVVANGRLLDRAALDRLLAHVEQAAAGQ